jgi:hypothetical protein
MAVSIDPWIGELRMFGAKGVDDYEKKLRSFGNDERKLTEFLAEARAALHFLRNGWEVTMRDRPDLMLRIDGETLYAEVKHMHEKETDRRDARAIANAKPFEWVQVGNIFDDENSDGWQQMCDIAVKKEPQYRAGAQNLLVFVSHSEALDLMLKSAVNEFNDRMWAAGTSSPLRKLGGMMMLSNIYGPSTGMSNVEFYRTVYPMHPISPRVASVLGSGQIA